MNDIDLKGARRVYRRGVTIIEFSMVLGISAFIAAGALAYFGSANTGAKVTDSLSQVAGIQLAVRSITGGQPDYAGVTAALVANSGQIPLRYVTGSPPTGMTSAFRSPITVRPTTTNDAFEVILTNVTRDACSRIASSDMGTGMRSVFVGANLAAVTEAQLTTRDGLGAYTAALANTTCNGPTRAIGWRFN